MIVFDSELEFRNPFDGGFNINPIDIRVNFSGDHKGIFIYTSFLFYSASIEIYSNLHED